MTLKRFFKDESNKLGLKSLDDLPLDVSLSTGTIFPLCFIVEDTNEYLFLQVSNLDDGTEEFYAVPKSQIEYLKIHYLSDKEFEPNEEIKRSYV